MILNGAILTLVVSSTMVFGATDAYHNVRSAALNITHVYSVASHLDHSDPAAADKLMASASGLQSLAGMVERNEDIILR